MNIYARHISADVHREQACLTQSQTGLGNLAKLQKAQTPHKIHQNSNY